MQTGLGSQKGLTSGPTIGRRAFGKLAMAGGALLLPGVPALAATVPPARVIPFMVAMDGGPVGTHTLAFNRDGDRMVVDIDIRLEVGSIITLFRYAHRNREVWENGRLVSLDTETDDDGTAYQVSGRASADGFRVTGGVEGDFVAPADVMPSSYWNIGTVDQTRVLDTQRGRMIDVATEQVGEETIEAAGTIVRANRYRMTGTLTVDVWYSYTGQWVKLAFNARGRDIEYTLATLDSGQSTLATGG